MATGSPPPTAMNSEAGSRVLKHSLLIAGHRTSVSLEAPFWRRFKAIASGRGLSVNVLAAKVDAARGGASLSSALRVFVLETPGSPNGDLEPSKGCPTDAATCSPTSPRCS